MKNIKKLLVVLMAVVLCLSMTACMANKTPGVASLEVSAPAAEGEEAPAAPSTAEYDKDIQGLCAYMEACKVTAGERIQMEYGVIGALNGYKYTYTYEGSQVQLEVYEFPTENISADAQNVIDSVKKDGAFKLLDNTIPAMLSANDRFMLIYTDERAKKEDANKAHKEHVVECFNTFTAE